MSLARAFPVRGVIAVVVLTATVTLTRDSGLAQEPTLQQLREKYAAAAAAYDKKDYPAYLTALQELAQLRPTHPRILSRLAAAFALNGRPSDTASTLEKLAALTLFVDVDKDPDFARVKDDPAVHRAAALMSEIRSRRVGAPDVAWTIHDRLFVPEGITYDPLSRTFFASSQYQRKIVAVDAVGHVKEFVTEGRDGLWMVFGLGVDARRRWVWAVSTADEKMRGFTAADVRHAGVFAFDIATSKLMRKITVDGDPPHYFDDLTVASDGRVFLSDGGIGAIYTIAPDGRELELFVQPGTIQGPNGLAISGDGRRLYVSDYAGYIFAIDIASRAATKLHDLRH
jgi:DNA-binding beta-propeller fold protein YncE